MCAGGSRKKSEGGSRKKAISIDSILYRLLNEEMLQIYVVFDLVEGVSLVKVSNMSSTSPTIGS